MVAFEERMSGLHWFTTLARYTVLQYVLVTPFLAHVSPCGDSYCCRCWLNAGNAHRNLVALFCACFCLLFGLGVSGQWWDTFAIFSTVSRKRVTFDQKLVLQLLASLLWVFEGFWIRRDWKCSGDMDKKGPKLCLVDFEIWTDGHYGMQESGPGSLLLSSKHMQWGITIMFQTPFEYPQVHKSGMWRKSAYFLWQLWLWLRRCTQCLASATCV